MAQDKLQVALDFAVQGTPTEKLETDIKKQRTQQINLKHQEKKQKEALKNYEIV